MKALEGTKTENKPQDMKICWDFLFGLRVREKSRQLIMQQHEDA